MKSHESSHLFLAQLPLVMGLLLDDEQMVMVVEASLRQSRKKTKRRQLNYSLFYE